MPDHYTPRLQLPYPDLDDPADVPADLQQLCTRLEAVIPGAGNGGGFGTPSLPVLEVGMTGQIRAGRQLTAADFTGLGLAAPIALWNLSDLADASGNGRNLTNKGAVTFAPGINGAANTAAQFTGSTAQALYIADTGAADPFRIKAGSWGCWLRTPRRGVGQYQMAKLSSVGTVPTSSWGMSIGPGGNVSGWLSDGTNVGYPTGVTDVADDRWHFVVITADGTMARVYVDGALEGVLPFGPLFASAAPVNIGTYGADGATAGNTSHAGRIDEAFVTADVLSEEQIRLLYAAKIAHGATFTPSAVRVNVHRRRRGALLAQADFSTAPLRLYNLRAGGPGLLADEGTQNAALVYQGGGEISSGPDGADRGASYHPNAAWHLSATDAGLPAGTNARTIGCWFKTIATPAGGHNVMGYGTVSTGDTRFTLDANGLLTAWNAGDAMSGPSRLNDGAWHHVACAEDNAATDGVKRKLYVDGRVVGNSTVLNAIVLSGATGCRIGANPGGTAAFTGSIARAFVCNYALTVAQILALYFKSGQDLGASPKNAGDHVEAIDATNVYWIGDTLEPQHTVDLGVSA